jgi:hypothetical protein
VRLLGTWCRRALTRIHFGADGECARFFLAGSAFQHERGKRDAGCVMYYHFRHPHYGVCSQYNVVTVSQFGSGFLGLTRRGKSGPSSPWRSPRCRRFYSGLPPHLLVTSRSPPSGESTVRGRASLPGPIFVMRWLCCRCRLHHRRRGWPRLMGYFRSLLSLLHTAVAIKTMPFPPFAVQAPPSPSSLESAFVSVKPLPPHFHRRYVLASNRVALAGLLVRYLPLALATPLITIWCAVSACSFPSVDVWLSIWRPTSHCRPKLCGRLPTICERFIILTYLFSISLVTNL